MFRCSAFPHALFVLIRSRCTGREDHMSRFLRHLPMAMLGGLLLLFSSVVHAAEPSRPWFLDGRGLLVLIVCIAMIGLIIARIRRI